MKHNTFSSIVIIGIIILFLAASGCITAPGEPKLEPVPDQYYADMNAALDAYLLTIDAQMKQINASVWTAARELDGVPADDPAVKLALLKLKSEIPLAYDAGRVTKENYLAAVTNPMGEKPSSGPMSDPTSSPKKNSRLPGTPVSYPATLHSKTENAASV